MAQSQILELHPYEHRQRTRRRNTESRTAADLNAIVDAIEHQVSPRRPVGCGSTIHVQHSLWPNARGRPAVTTLSPSNGAANHNSRDAFTLSEFCRRVPTRSS